MNFKTLRTLYRFFCIITPIDVIDFTIVSLNNNKKNLSNIFKIQTQTWKKQTNYKTGYFYLQIFLDFFRFFIDFLQNKTIKKLFY